MQFIPVVAKLNFQHLLLKKHFLILSVLKTALLNIIVEIMIHFSEFFELWLLFKIINGIGVKL